jgi:hypothetical protein
MLKLNHQVYCLILLCNNSYSQISVTENLPETKNFNYKFIIEIPLYECDILGQINESEKLLVAEPLSVFTIVGTKNEDSVIIRFWTWKNNPALNSILCYADSLCIRRKYFLVAAKDVSEKAISRYEQKAFFTAGSVLIPVKLRLQKFDFSKDITLGPVAGVKMRLSNYSNNFISMVCGLGVTSITLDERSTNGVVEESLDVPALTPSVGVVFDFFNSAQAGLFCGWDFISNNEEYHLIYYKKPWISFGLGFSILSKSDTNYATTERTQK